MIIKPSIEQLNYFANQPGTLADNCVDEVDMARYYGLSACNQAVATDRGAMLVVLSPWGCIEVHVLYDNGIRGHEAVSLSRELTAYIFNKWRPRVIFGRPLLYAHHVVHHALRAGYTSRGKALNAAGKKCYLVTAECEKWAVS